MDRTYALAVLAGGVALVAVGGALAAFAGVPGVGFAVIATGAALLPGAAPRVEPRPPTMQELAANTAAARARLEAPR